MPLSPLAIFVRRPVRDPPKRAQAISPPHRPIGSETSADRLAALRAGRLDGLRTLSLAGLGLSEVPDELFGLADTLEELDLSGNRLRTLPDDFSRLGRLRILFASGNPFDRLPSVLGECSTLSQIGARGCGLRDIPAEALPPNLRWLTVTDNALATLPRALGERPSLQKLMLAGNRLDGLPGSLAAASNLELIRLASNRFEALPPWLAELPRLAWLAWSGNPLDATPAVPPPEIPWAELQMGTLLGQGASGHVHAATRHREGTAPEEVAVKLYKGVMTSDGLPACEMAACLAAGAHRHLAGGLGRIAGHPEGVDALVMPLLPAHWRVLAGPPSLASCSRDVYDPSLRVSADAGRRIAAGIAAAGAHIHRRGLLHGDLYAHNILWDGERGEAVLSDFGAASFLPPGDASALGRLDVLAFGILLGELIAHADPVEATIHDLQRACTATTPAERPRMAEVADVLSVDRGGGDARKRSTRSGSSHRRGSG